MIKKNKNRQTNGTYKKQIRQCLKKMNLFPIGKNKNWIFFKIIHRKPNRNETQKNKNPVRNIVKNSVVNKSGIYVYKKGDKILYIGKAKKLRSRLNAHYTESYRKAPQKTNAKRWYRFFSKNKGKLKVYWKEVEGEKNRKVLEQMLTFVCRPEFAGETE